MATPFFVIGWLMVVMVVDAYTVRLVPEEGGSKGDKSQNM